MTTYVVNGLQFRYKNKAKPKYRVDGNDVYIELTQGKEAIVSIEDLDLATQFKWCYTNYGYAFTRVSVLGEYLTLYLHQLLTGVGFGMKKHSDVVINNTLLADHINGDRSDNRRSNLRAVTHHENMQNTRPSGGKYYKQKPSSKYPKESIQSVKW